jgi:hypothetical protein
VSDVIEEVENLPITMPANLEQATDANKRLRSGLIDIYYMVEQETVSSICDFRSIIMGPVNMEEIIHLSSLELTEDIREEAVRYITEDENVGQVLKM